MSYKEIMEDIAYIKEFFNLILNNIDEEHVDEIDEMPIR